MDTPGTNNGMTPQTPTSQPGAPQNTPMAASPSQSRSREVSGENLRTMLNNLNSPNSVTSPRVTDARSARRQVLMTPRPSDGEDNENFEATPPGNGSKEEVDLIELRF